MSSKNEIIINNTSYSIEEDWIEVAKRLLTEEGGKDFKLSLLKAGFFGYFNEIASNEIKNNVYHRNVLYDEHFLNTAVITKSIYNFAKIMNYNVNMAAPASISVNLSMPKSQIVNSSKFIPLDNNKTSYKFVLGQDIDFTIKNLNFKLPYEVQLFFTYSNIDKDYTVTASYNYNDNASFPYYNSTDPYIKVWEADYNGERYIFLKLELFQISKCEKEETISTEDVSVNIFKSVQFNDQLSFFNIYYELNGKKSIIHPYFNNTYTPEDEQFCYYNIVNDNIFEISFSPLSGCFRPAYNSKICFELYTTKGALGNFEYDGEINVNFNKDDELNSIPMLVTPLTDSAGGTNKPTNTELKKILVNKYMSRDNIITDLDLDSFFNSIDSREKINNSSIKFIKKRNDMIKRLYNAFLLLKDSNGMIMPTKTLPSIDIITEKLQNMNYSISEKTAIVYDKETRDFSCVYNDNEINKCLNNPDYLVYTIPYLLNIEREPVLNVKYYNTFIDKDIVFNYKNLNPNIPFKFLITNFNINRNSMITDTYTMQLTLSTNLVEDKDINDVLKIRGILKSISGETYGYFDFEKVTDNDYLYEAYLTTEKLNSIKNGRLNLYNSLYSLDSSNTNQVINCLVSNEVNMEIQILYKSKYSNTKYGDALKMSDISDYASACVFTNNETIKLFQSLNTLMESTIVPTGTGMKIYSIPLIEYNYFKSNMSSVFSILESYNNLLSENINKLENNTSIDIKFYNTHGESYWFCKSISESAVSGEITYDMIDRIDLTLDLNIYLNKTLNTDEDNAIRKFISDFIEASNEDSVFPVSNLITELENNFDIIKYIEFNTINGFDIQKVISKFKNLNELTKPELRDYVPEYLNLRKEVSTVTNEENVSEKVYKYDITINYI